MKLQTVRNAMSRRVQKGVTMIEYALIAAVVAVALIGALTTLKGDLASTFTTIGSEMNKAKPTGSTTTTP